MKIARSGILGEFASAYCSYGVGIERKRAYGHQGCPKGTTEAINRAFCWSRLLVTPTAINYLHMHTGRSSTRTLAIASAIFCTLAHAGHRSIFAGSMNDGNC